MHADRGAQQRAYEDCRLAWTFPSTARLGASLIALSWAVMGFGSCSVLVPFADPLPGDAGPEGTVDGWGDHDGDVASDPDAETRHIDGTPGEDGGPEADADRRPDGDRDGECVPHCDGRRCGADGCDGDCGRCSTGTVCCQGQCWSPGTSLVGPWVLVSPGTFTMGTPSTESGREADEEAHSVELTRPYWIQATETTQEQYEHLMGGNPSFFRPAEGFPDCPDCPVENVSWSQAARFCNALSAAAGLDPCYSCPGASGLCDATFPYSTPYECSGFRLPTEAEWEHAARAGETESTYNGSPVGSVDCDPSLVDLSEISYYCGNSGFVEGTPTPPRSTRSFAPNPWGLWDMLGNVWEWTNDGCTNVARGSETLCDDYGPNPGLDPTGRPEEWTKVSRGGSMQSGWQSVRSGNRGVTGQAGKRIRGFRPARTAVWPVP